MEAAAMRLIFKAKMEVVNSKLQTKGLALFKISLHRSIKSTQDKSSIKRPLETLSTKIKCMAR